MAMLEYNSPPIWLNAHIQDPRIIAGDYTYFDRHISLAILTPDDRIEIGKFCSLADNYSSAVIDLAKGMPGLGSKRAGEKRIAELLSIAFAVKTIEFSTIAPVRDILIGVVGMRSPD